MTFIEFNISESVMVMLTERGRRCIAYTAESIGLAPHIPKEDAKGWSSWQLWCLIEEFGPYIHLGCLPPFETVIRIPINSEVCRDAERYRYLCECKEWPRDVSDALDCDPKVLIDEAIDAEIKKAREVA